MYGQAVLPAIVNGPNIVLYNIIYILIGRRTNTTHGVVINSLTLGVYGVGVEAVTLTLTSTMTSSP